MPGSPSSALERIAFLRTSRGFIRFWEEAVEPQDERQREAIEAVLEQAGRRLAEHMRTSRGEMQNIIDSTKTELGRPADAGAARAPGKAHAAKRAKSVRGPPP